VNLYGAYHYNALVTLVQTEQDSLHELFETVNVVSK